MTATRTLCVALFLASLECSLALESSLFFSLSLPLDRRDATTQLAVGAHFTQLCQYTYSNTLYIGHENESRVLQYSRLCLRSTITKL